MLSTPYRQRAQPDDARCSVEHGPFPPRWSSLLIALACTLLGLVLKCSRRRGDLVPRAPLLSTPTRSARDPRSARARDE